MDVVNAEQAKIAEEAGACAVMALERVPADIRKDGGVARMSDPKLIKEIMAAVTIPVFAKVFILKDVKVEFLSRFNRTFICFRSALDTLPRRKFWNIWAWT